MGILRVCIPTETKYKLLPFLIEACSDMLLVNLLCLNGSLHAAEMVC